MTKRQYIRNRLPRKKTFSVITEINKIPHNGIVYNLSVEDDHSYVSETGAICANCFIPVNNDARFTVIHRGGVEGTCPACSIA